MELINDLYSCEGRLEYLLEKHEVGEISMKTDKSTAKEISSLNEIKKEEKRCKAFERGVCTVKCPGGEKWCLQVK